MFKRVGLTVLSIAMIAGAMMIATPASAAICASMTTCTLTFNDSASNKSGPFGTVELDLVGSTIHITLNMAPSFIIDSGSHFSLTFDSNVAGETLSMPAAMGTSGTPATYTLVTPDNPAGGFMNSPFGNFQHAIAGSCTHPGSCTDQSVTFIISSNTRTFNDVNDLVAQDSNNNALFAADIFFGTTGPTFVVGVNTTGAPVPEPSPYLAVLFGGFGVMAWVGQRRKSLTASK
jgi:hypothetical protein